MCICIDIGQQGLVYGFKHKVYMRGCGIRVYMSVQKIRAMLTKGHKGTITLTAQSHIGQDLAFSTNLVAYVDRPARFQVRGLCGFGICGLGGQRLGA